jgi:hypothetical protein
VPILLGAVHFIVALTSELADVIGASGVLGAVIPP